MASFILLLPIASGRFRSLSISASTNSNGATPSTAKGRMVVEIPLDKIRRPLMRTRANDQQKVKELMDSIAEIGLQVPGFPAVIVMKRIRSWGYRQFDVKYVVEQKKL
uniref:Sulfiredoxin n=1 Tax=Kalanchoe fedtschenkoi TaxID=63787 RepID=A0A7N1A311_KALFE